MVDALIPMPGRAWTGKSLRAEYSNRRTGFWRGLMPDLFKQHQYLRFVDRMLWQRCGIHQLCLNWNG